MAGQITYVDQSAEELRLNLVQGAVDKESLTVLCTGQITGIPYGRVEAGIIGASHYFQIIRPDGTVLLTEVFACVELDESENRIYCGNLGSSRNVQQVLNDRQCLLYNFTAEKLTWDTGKEKFHSFRRLVQSNPMIYEIGLSFNFASDKRADKFPPVTMVHVKADSTKMSTKVETLHAYPNEDALVFTKTTISGEQK